MISRDMLLSGVRAYQAYFKILVKLFCYADSLQEIHLFHDKIPIFKIFAWNAREDFVGSSLVYYSNKSTILYVLGRYEIPYDQGNYIGHKLLVQGVFFCLFFLSKILNVTQHYTPACSHYGHQFDHFSVVSEGLCCFHQHGMVGLTYYNIHEPWPVLPWRRSQWEAQIRAVAHSKHFIVAVKNEKKMTPI